MKRDGAGGSDLGPEDAPTRPHRRPSLLPPLASFDASPRSGTDQPADLDALLGRAELLLAEAEIDEAESGGERRAQALREAIDRMRQGAVQLRLQAGESAEALLEEARRERAKIAAETEALRREVAMLRAERDLHLALALDAGEAVARRLAQWHDVQSAERAPEGQGDLLRSAEPSRQPVDRGLAEPDRLRGLAGATVSPGAGDPAAGLAITIRGLPGLTALADCERALSGLAAVASCAVQSLRAGNAELRLWLRVPTAPLVLAADLLALANAPIAVESVGEQGIAGRWLPPLPIPQASFGR